MEKVKKTEKTEKKEERQGISVPTENEMGILKRTLNIFREYLLEIRKETDLDCSALILIQSDLMPEDPLAYLSQKHFGKEAHIVLMKIPLRGGLADPEETALSICQHWDGHSSDLNSRFNLGYCIYLPLTMTNERTGEALTGHVLSGSIRSSDGILSFSVPFIDDSLNEILADNHPASVLLSPSMTIINLGVAKHLFPYDPIPRSLH